jgi:hypothetical protein
MKDFKPKTTTSTAEAFDPSQDNINKRTKIVEFEACGWRSCPRRIAARP